MLPYIVNVFIPGSAFFFIREWQIALVWMMALFASIFIWTPLSFLLYIGTFLHFYLVKSNPSNLSLQPAHRWVKQKWGWLTGGLLVTALALAPSTAPTADRQEPTPPAVQDATTTEQPVPESTTATVEPVTGTTKPPAETAVAEVPVEEVEEAVPAPAPEEPAEAAAPAYADQLLTLGTNPESTPAEMYGVEQDRHNYVWVRPDLGERVSSIWRSADDWWIEIQNPTFAASDLGKLEPVDEGFSRVTTGPLAGLLVMDRGPVNIHLQTQTYYDTEQALLQGLDAQEAQPIVEETPVIEEPAPLPVVEKVPAEEPSLYFSNCSEAEAAGYTNMTPDHPGYRAGLDKDDDGLACES